MPDDGRFDLSGDLDKVQSDLLKNVKAATDEVKQRQAAIKAQDAKASERAKSRKNIGLLAAIGAIVVILLSYYIVFARPDSGQSAGSGNAAGGNAQQTQKVVIKTVPDPARAGSAAPTPRNGGAYPTRDSQVVSHPPDDYEQPSRDSGM